MIMLRTVGARFPGAAQTYTYFVPEDDNPEVGDLLVTSVHFTPDYSRGPFADAQTALADAKMATVTEVHPAGTPAGKASKFYVALVKARHVAAQAEANARLFQRVQVDRAARKELDEMLRQEDTRLRYQRLAETNPRARELLQQLGELPAAEPDPTPSGRVEVTPPKAARKSGVTAYNGGTGVDPQQEDTTKRGRKSYAAGAAAAGVQND